MYDVNTQTWEYNSSISSNSGNTISNQNGVVAWVSAAGTVGAATYDPILKTWMYNSAFSSNSGNTISNIDGVVAWVSSAGTVGAATYDPALQYWAYNSSISSNAGNTITNNNGVVAWVSAAGTVGAAIYDPASQYWNYNSSFTSNSGNTILNSNGVVAWISSSGTIGAATYDPYSQNWNYNSSMSSSSNNQNLSLNNGTVMWQTSSGIETYGYSSNSQSWNSSQNTELSCKLFISRTSGATPFITYLWCLTIGANSYSYACGDGHTITRRWAWKQYNIPGTYNPVLTIFNSAQNATCSSQVQVVVTQSISDPNAFTFSISPNPSNGAFLLQIENDKLNNANILVYTVSGKLIYSEILSDRSNNLINLSSLSSGIYFMKIVSEKGEYTNKISIQ